MYGKTHSDETKKKMSESRKGQYNEVSQKAATESVKGTHFYNNGNESKRFKPGEQPDGWVRGRHMNINTNRNPMSEERKEQQSKRLKGKVPKANLMKIECPHCGKVGQPANMKRWHFDNCGKTRTLSINNKTYECKCGLTTNNPGAFSKHKKVCKVQ